MWFWYLPISFCPKKTHGLFFFDVLILWAFGGDPSLENSTGIILGLRNPSRLHSDLNEGFFGWDPPSPQKVVENLGGQWSRFASL